MNSILIGKALILVTLVAGGVAGGIYLSSREAEVVGTKQNEKLEQAPAIQDAPIVHRFPLSALDVKDTVEAPDLIAGQDKTLYLCWGSKTSATERSVLFTRSTDGGKTFDPVRTISRGGIYKSQAKEGGKAVGYERRTSPHLAISGANLHLSWSEARTDGSAMRMLLATSQDHGVSFGKAVETHHGAGANPTFTSLTSGPGTAVAAAWLDDREGVQLPYAAQFNSSKGEFLPEIPVRSGKTELGVCPCCPTGACYAPDGTLYVAYRNVQDGYRDIAIGRLRPGQTQFEGPFPVIPNTWQFNGCPHDGPSLTVTGDTLHILWMDARTGSQRCYYATAKTDNLNFVAQELDSTGPGTQGNARLLADSHGGIHAVWEQSLGAEVPSDGTHSHGAPKITTGRGRAIYHSYMPKGATQFPAGKPISAKTGAFQTRPTIAITAAGRISIVWNELETTGKALVFVSLPATTAGN